MEAQGMVDDIQAELFGMDVSYKLSGDWLAYWTFILRLVVGFWLFHAGITKYMASEPFSAAWFVGGAAKGTVLGFFITLFSKGVLLDVVNYMIPLGELLIGLGLLVGLLVRTASYFGVTLMVFFVTVNHGWKHGFVNGDLMGLLLFATLIVLGAGRVWGLDAIVEDTGIVKRYPSLRYFLG